MIKKGLVYSDHPEKAGSEIVTMDSTVVLDFFQDERVVWTLTD